MRVYGEYDRAPWSGTVCPEKTMTRQSEADACDVNRIMARYVKTGVLPQGSGAGFYADVTEAGDFMVMQEKVAQVCKAFSLLDAPVRQRFENDPALWLDYLGSPEGQAEVSKAVAAEAAVPPVAAESPSTPTG